MITNRYKLGEIAIFNAENINKSDKFSEIEYLDTSSIQEGCITETQFLDRKTAPSRAKRKVKNDTIIYSTVRPNLKHYGILKNPPENLIVSTGFATIDLRDDFKKKIFPDYLYLLLSQEYITNYLHGIAQNSVSSYPSINPSDIANLSFLFPEFTEQKRIAKVFTDIESKIAMNKKINKELEAMSKELYDYWFVQFDFPSKDGRPYKSSGGKMVFNEILQRQIPEAWNVKSIASLISGNIGGDWGKEGAEGNYQLKVSCCRGADIVSMTDLPTRYILNSNSSKLLKEDDLVIEISGGSPIQSTGRCVLISKEILQSFDNKLICSNFCQALSISDKDYVSYFYLMWKMFYDSDTFFNFEGKTSGIKNFQYDTFVSEKWYIPPKELAKKFGEIISLNYKKKCALDQENKRLLILRDELLPMLMNGQVTVK